MSRVTASVLIDASPERVWEMVMDPARLEQWVTIHRRLLDAQEGPPRVGYTMDQQLNMRGVSVEVHWRLAECRPAELAIWEGRGPAGSQALIEYELTREDGGTRFDYRNEFRPPLGPIGAIVSRALVGGMPVREARRSLARLQERIEQASSEQGN